MRNYTAVIGSLCICAALLVIGIPVPVEADVGRFFQELSYAESSAERREICDRTDPASLPLYASHFHEGYLLLLEGGSTSAERYLERALEIQPELAIGCVLYAEHYLEKGNLDAAERWYTRARGIAPDRLDPHYGLGLIWLRRAATQGAPAYKEALASLREMTRIEPDSPDGWANVGMVLAKLNRYSEARGNYKRALDLSPDDPEIQHSLGSLASIQGDEQAAREAWERALNLDPTHAPSAIELAASLGRVGRIDEAVDELEQATRAVHVGADAGRVRRDLALLYILGERHAEASGLLEQARVHNPDAQTLSALAHIRMMEGQTPAALGHFLGAAAADSSIVAPFLHAWAVELQSVLDFEAEDPRAERIVRQVLASTPETLPSTGTMATRRLVARLLPEWELPEGKVDTQGTPSNAPYDTPPVPVYRALASYPDAAGGVDGTVVVRVTIDAKGVVRDTEVVSKGGNPALEWAALDAAKRYRFKPAQLKGEPVESEVTIPFQFSGRR